MADSIPASPASSAPPPTGRPRRVLRALKRLFALGLLLAVAGALGVVGIFLYYGRELPTFEKLNDYRPPQVTRVYDRKGEVVAEFFHERRTVVPIEKIPRVLKQAVLAAEDANFYEHTGLDYLGILRAVIMDVRHMKLAQGASTITQQVVKNLVLSSERSIARKVKEAILARRLEQNLTKDEILFLYLNHIYFGHHRYGVEEAARFYFGKGVEQLSLGEAAVLAGLPQSPARLSPLRDPAKAKHRQTYVLSRMAENGFITRAQADAEIKRPILLSQQPFEPVGPYYAEEVRRQLVERYGEQTVYAGGLRVELGMDRQLQVLADAALRTGLEDLDRRFGYRAPTVSVEAALLAQARPKLLEMLQKRLPTRDTAAGKVQTVWDFGSVDAERARVLELLLGAVDVRPLEPGM
ncbi:MAG: transglycosylase domain-containing protein, partial [Myxococcales bacterium]